MSNQIQNQIIAHFQYRHINISFHEQRVTPEMTGVGTGVGERVLAVVAPHDATNHESLPKYTTSSKYVPRRVIAGREVPSQATGVT